jgi:3'-phosphoadenosine 5'-phosphosulfate (PAPS) 3'-phosphatase
MIPGIPDSGLLRPELKIALSAASEAGEILLGFLDRVRTERKADGEMVSEADRAADAVIRSRLSATFPNDALLTEETPDDGSRFQCDRVWIVDPLDGTREYLSGVDEWALHIALSQGGDPILGIVHRPSRGETWVGIPGEGAWVRRERNGPFQDLNFQRAKDDFRVILSHRDLGEVGKAWLACMPPHQEVRCGGSGLKAVLVAEGHCHLYGALTPKMKEWDTCAPHAVVVGARGTCTDLAGRQLKYNRSNLYADQGFLVVAPGLAEELASNLKCAALVVPWLRA